MAVDWVATGQSWFTSISFLFNRFIIALVLFLIGLVLGRLLGNFVTRLMKELEVGKIVKKATKKSTKVEEKTGKVVSYIVYIFAALVALDYLGLTTPLLMWVSVAFLVILIIAFALGIKDYIPNLIAGIILHKQKTFKEGDTIKAGDIEGKVIVMGLAETELKSGEDRIFVPNSTFTKKRVRVIKS